MPRRFLPPLIPMCITSQSYDTWAVKVDAWLTNFGGFLFISWLQEAVVLISVWWILPALLVGGIFGFFAAAVCYVASDMEEEDERRRNG